MAKKKALFMTALLAVAFGLTALVALLADKTIPHPPLEVIVTVDEETGMFGATGIDLSMLKGRTLINLDSEDEGVLTVSCAGGITAHCVFEFIQQYHRPAYEYEISVSGLPGL